MKRLPDLRPNRWDLLVLAAVLVLTVASAAPFLPRRVDTALTVVVTADGRELDRFPAGVAVSKTYESRGYTLTLTADGGGVCVAAADCPSQDCVHTGTVSRAGESIVCLPAHLTVTLAGAADYDLIAG